MTDIELLAPAGNTDIGIAAIDCGADAVYIAGPDFGARVNAGNSIDEIARLCAYASRFGARIFVTFNILLRDDELAEAHRQMLLCQKAGASAFIIRDPRLCAFDDITIPLHASTQCAIRDAGRAKLFEDAGCSRIVLERELSLAQIRVICAAVSCEVECFVHGALCVCYSGQCTLSQELTGRSADRGECIQACRNLYDLVDSTGRIWARNKALLSLKDLQLMQNLEPLLDAGVCSLKIEGRLKNSTYVKNVVRAYSQALDNIVARHPDKYRRASFGRIEGGFIPSLDKIFNRSYTRMQLDPKDLSWANTDAPKSMGEKLAKVKTVRFLPGGMMECTLQGQNLKLCNGDGFAFIQDGRIIGFRADKAWENTLVCKKTDGLKSGVLLYRNFGTAFEKEIEENPCKRYIPVCLHLEKGLCLRAESIDGRNVEINIPAGETALNRERALSIYKSQLEKHSGVYSFRLAAVDESLELVHLSASILNSLRRETAEKLDALPVRVLPLRQKGTGTFHEGIARAYEAGTGRRKGELMRSKYCIRRELGCCLKEGGRKAELFLVNNGRRFPLHFDCSLCEMAVLE